MKDVYEILKAKGITLPSIPPKGGVYSPVKEFCANLYYCSGCGPLVGDENYLGKLGKDFTTEEGQKAAYNCMLNLLSILHHKLGDLNRIKKCVKILAFVNCSDDFVQQPQVINGASELLLDIFGEDVGCPARSAIGTNSLPGNIACEIEMLIECK